MTEPVFPPVSKVSDPHEARIADMAYAVVRDISAVLDQRQVPPMYRSEVLEEVARICTWSPEA